MKCESIQDWLLRCEAIRPRTWPRKVAKHVKICASCHEFARSLKRLESAWRNQPVPIGAERPSASFLRTIAQIEETAAAPKPWRPIRWAASLGGIAAMLLIGVGVTGYLLFGPVPGVIAEPSDVVERLIEWNTQLASADAGQRKQLLEESEEKFRNDLKASKLGDEDREMAESLLVVARKLATNEDLVEEANIIDDVANKLATRAEVAGKKGDPKVVERCGKSYYMFMENAYNPFKKKIDDMKAAQAKGGPPDKKSSIDFSTQQQKQLDKIWERSPQKTRPDLHKKWEGIYKKGFTGFNKFGGGGGANRH